MRKWRNGSRASLRGWWEQSRGGSSPPFRTLFLSIIRIQCWLHSVANNNSSKIAMRSARTLVWNYTLEGRGRWCEERGWHRERPCGSGGTVDATGSEPVGRNSIEVQVLSAARMYTKQMRRVAELISYLRERDEQNLYVRKYGPRIRYEGRLPWNSPL